MFYVPLYFEALRSRPVLVFWLATLAQAALWIVVPLLFYAAPPGDLAQLLAIGHEFPLDGDFGPPLAYWLAEIAFRAGGLFGVYALSQICRDRDLLVRVRARPRDRRRHARGHGGAADGRHFGVHGADAGFRPADPCHGAVGSGAAVLLAGRDRRPSAILVRARRRGGAPPAHHATPR